MRDARSDDLRDMQVLVAEKHRPGDGEIRLLALPVRTALAVQRPDALLPEASAGDSGSAGSSQRVAKPMNETTLVLTVKHAEPLPEQFKAIVEQRSYDWLSARGIRADVVVSVEVTEVADASA